MPSFRPSPVPPPIRTRDPRVRGQRRQAYVARALAELRGDRHAPPAAARLLAATRDALQQHGDLAAR